MNSPFVTYLKGSLNKSFKLFCKHKLCFGYFYPSEKIILNIDQRYCNQRTIYVQNYKITLSYSNDKISIIDVYQFDVLKLRIYFYKDYQQDYVISTIEVIFLHINPITFETKKIIESGDINILKEVPRYDFAKLLF